MPNFSNAETALMFKWHCHEIEMAILDYLEEHEQPEQTEMVAYISEKVEDLIKEESLSVLPEGYVSELIHLSFDQIHYDELLNFFMRG